MNLLKCEANPPVRVWCFPITRGKELKVVETYVMTSIESISFDKWPRWPCAPSPLTRNKVNGTGAASAQPHGLLLLRFVPKSQQPTDAAHVSTNQRLQSGGTPVLTTGKTALGITWRTAELSVENPPIRPRSRTRISDAQKV